jgi:DedD protein
VVQLGSFSNSRNAAALRDKLRAKGYSAFVESSGSGTAAVTRVFVGPEAKRESAERAVGRLFEETRLKGIVVRHPGS